MLGMTCRRWSGKGVGRLETGVGCGKSRVGVSMEKLL